MLAEWIVTSDQPFSEAENPFFRRMLQYVHGRNRKLQIPGKTTTRRHIMQMGEDTKKDIKTFFKVCAHSHHAQFFSKLTCLTES